MANSYTQLYIQIIFAVQGRQNLIAPSWREEIFKYLAGTIDGLGHKPIIVNGVADHIHAFVGLNPDKSISSLVRDLKNNSSNFVNDKKFVRGKFSWQSGYGAFSYGRSQLDTVYNYVLNQEKHHKVITFKEEYISFLKAFDIKYDERYLFEWIEL